MKSINFLLILIIFALATSITSARRDPGPLQGPLQADFCIAVDDPRKALFVNGKYCKNPKFADANDFYTPGLNSPGNTNNSYGSSVTTVTVDKIPGLNTLGISLTRIDYAPNGQNPLHTHPRGSELLAVAVGKLYVGFVSSNQDGNRLFTKILNQGDVFVFPIGLMHFEVNIGRTPAVAFTVLSSEDPGFVTIAKSVFGSDPSINSDALARAFKLDKKVVESLQKQFRL